MQRAIARSQQVNGDANYMKNEFYDICDEFGILIHNEFMLSDTDYSSSVRAALQPNPDSGAREQPLSAHISANGATFT